MHVHHFDRLTGRYRFTLARLHTDWHAHPVTELLWTPAGNLEVATEGEQHTGIQLAIIPANLTHRVYCATGPVSVLLLDLPTPVIQHLLSIASPPHPQSVYLASTNTYPVDPLPSLLEAVHDHPHPSLSDPLVRAAVERLRRTALPTAAALTQLAREAHLSESRFSHRFKAAAGISLRQYLVWCRLNRAFERVLTGACNLGEAALQSGFHDAAHLSKAFRQYLGLSPSTVYNSRTVQG